MNNESYTPCARCGTPVKDKNVIFICGTPYGCECATIVLGLKQLPAWFNGGDWDSAKAQHDNTQEKLQEELQERRAITRKNWNGFIRLSKAHLNARKRDNDWEIKFIENISRQVGFPNLTVGGCEFSTMEDAEQNWNGSLGTFPYLYREIKGIESLSEKQLNLLEKIER